MGIMDTLTTILLNDNWVYFFAENQRDDYSHVGLDVAGWIPLEKLSDWGVTSSGQGGADWFRCTIALSPTKSCVNYVLQIRNAPQTIAIFLNGQFVDEVPGGESFNGDVTEYVALGENTLAMQLTCLSNACGGSFGSISLQPIACK
jgi:hypothetical protein